MFGMLILNVTGLAYKKTVMYLNKFEYGYRGMTDLGC